MSAIPRYTPVPRHTLPSMRRPSQASSDRISEDYEMQAPSHNIYQAILACILFVSIYYAKSDQRYEFHARPKDFQKNLELPRQS